MNPEPAAPIKISIHPIFAVFSGESSEKTVASVTLRALLPRNAQLPRCFLSSQRKTRACFSLRRVLSVNDGANQCTLCTGKSEYDHKHQPQTLDPARISEVVAGVECGEADDFLGASRSIWGFWQGFIGTFKEAWS